MRISDWSSDVCSSDLLNLDLLSAHVQTAGSIHPLGQDFRAFRSGHPPWGTATGQRRNDADLEGFGCAGRTGVQQRSEEHTSELQSLMRISYAVFCLKKKKQTVTKQRNMQDDAATSRKTL